MQMEWPWRRGESGDRGVAPVDAGKTGLAARWRRLPPPLKMAAILFSLILFWYGVIGTMRARIETDLNLRPSAQQLPVGGSVAVANAARLLERQVQELAFTPNDPVFYPTGLATRTPAFQAEIIHTTAGFIEALAAGSDSEPLAAAAEDLQTPPQHWWLRPAMPPVGRPAERVYGDAIEHLVAYNRELADDSDRPPPATALSPQARAALASLLDEVEAQAANIDRAIRENGRSDRAVQLSAARGAAYASALLMRGLRDDHLSAIRISGRAARWGEAIDQLGAAANVDSTLGREQDLVRAGYALLMAGNAMRAILDAPPQERSAA